MVKAALWILGIVAVTWLTFGVRLGPQPLAGHLHDIWLAKESRALRQGISDEVHTLLGHPPAKAEAEKSTTTEPLDPVAADDRARLSKLVSAKTGASKRATR